MSEPKKLSDEDLDRYRQAANSYSTWPTVDGAQEMVRSLFGHLAALEAELAAALKRAEEAEATVQQEHGCHIGWVAGYRGLEGDLTAARQRAEEAERERDLAQTISAQRRDQLERARQRLQEVERWLKSAVARERATTQRLQEVTAALERIRDRRVGNDTDEPPNYCFACSQFPAKEGHDAALPCGIAARALSAPQPVPPVEPSGNPGELPAVPQQESGATVAYPVGWWRAPTGVWDHYYAAGFALSACQQYARWADTVTGPSPAGPHPCAECTALTRPAPTPEASPRVSGGERCGTCLGLRKIPVAAHLDPWAMLPGQPCPDCAGTGKRPPSAGADCTCLGSEAMHVRGAAGCHENPVTVATPTDVGPTMPECLRTMTPENLAAFTPITDEQIAEAVAKGARDRARAMGVPIAAPTPPQAPTDGEGGKK